MNYPAEQYAQPIGQVRQQMYSAQPIVQGGGAQQSPIMSMSTTQAPACLTPDQIQQITNCFANPGSPNCTALLANAGLPLCVGSQIPMPQCKDTTFAAQLSYCEKYGPTGPDQAGNAFCWLASKDPAWYDAAKKLPACGGAATGGKSMLMWGGILLAVAAVGGITWYALKGKKKGPKQAAYAENRPRRRRRRRKAAA